MEFRKIFDTIPEKFDRWRPRYCQEAFDSIISHAQLDCRKSVLEIGPGTGQATEPILKTGCNYLAVELGEHLADFTKNKFKNYSNFHIVTGDFETYDFGDAKFDLIFSAATIQWIPEQIAFSRSFELLKKGGYLAMMLLRGDYKTPNEALYNEIQEVYQKYFHPETPYTQKLIYQNATNYGFTDFQELQFHSKREFNAENYIEYLGTHCDHIVLQEPYKSLFFNGIKTAILNHGDKIVFNDTVVLYLTRKP
jgi:SAM-dependent methyltransferase